MYLVVLVLLAVIAILLVLLRRTRRTAYQQGYQDGLALGLRRNEAERESAFVRGKRAAARELEDLLDREGGMSLSA